MSNTSVLTAELDPILRETKLLGQADRERAERVAKTSNLSLAEALIALGILSEDQIYLMAADRWNLDFVFPCVDNVDRDLLCRFPPDLLRDFSAIPLIEGTDATVVAFPMLPERAVLKRLQQAAGRPIQPALATHRRITHVLDHVLSSGDAAPARAGSLDASGTTLFYAHLTDALGAGARMLQFQPLENGLRVLERGPQGLRERAVEPGSQAVSIASRARMLAHLPMPGAPTFQEGNATLRFQGRSTRLRVTITPTPSGEVVTISVAKNDGLPRDPAAFGIVPDSAARLEALLASAWRREAGRIVVVASGQAELRRALGYALLTSADAPGVVATVEPEPLRYEPRFVQLRTRDLEPEDILAAALATDPDLVLMESPMEDDVVRACMERRTVVWCLPEHSVLRAWGYASSRLGELRSEWLLAAIAVHAFGRLCKDCSRPDPRAETSPLVPEGARVPLGCCACRETGHEGIEFFPQVVFSGESDENDPHAAIDSLVTQGLITVDEAWGVTQ